jgi:hypothetical protein
MGHVLKVKNSIRRPTSGITASSGGTQGSSGSIGLLQPSDFTVLGAFRLPTSPSYGTEYYGLDLPSGLTGRYVNGQLRLYSMSTIGGYNGTVVEYSVPADGFLTTTPPYPNVSNGGSIILNHFDDIFQNELSRFVGDGNSDPGPGGRFGLTNSGAALWGLYWDPIDSRMYWTSWVSYNTTYSTSDTCLGYSTITSIEPPPGNGGTSATGVGMGMWKLSPPNQYAVTYGNRWCTHPFPIPIAFANAYCGGRRLGIGFGGSASILSNGPPSEGPALYAINPPTVGVDPDHDYIATEPVRLLHCPPLKVPPKRAPRPPALYCANDYDDFDPTQWNWADGPVAGTWIDGPNKHGVVCFCTLTGGNGRGTILASPAPTPTAFAVTNPGDTAAGDYIKWQTNLTDGQSDYPFVVGTVQGVSGNIISIVPGTIQNGNPTLGGDMSGAIPRVGGYFLCGAWYQGGGGACSRLYNALYLYDPAGLALVAQGGHAYTQENVAPYSMTSFQLAGQTYPFLGGFNAGAPGAARGAWFDPTTKRLYMLHISLLNGPRLVYVYSVNC